MDSAGCPCLASHCKSPCGIYNLSQYWGLWYNNSLILSFLQPTAPMCHYFVTNRSLRVISPRKDCTKMTAPVIGTSTQHKLTADELLDLQRERVERICRHPEGASERMLGCVPATGQEQSWNRAGFSDVLGPCSGSDYFYLGASWLWCPPAHEQKVHSSMCSIGVLLLTKANQAADWKSRADTCDECTVGHRVIGCNEICPLKS